MSSGEALENTSQNEATPAIGGELAAQKEEDHSHHHAAPTLNPACTREIEIEVSAGEVASNFQSVVKRYRKMAKIPGFRSGKVPESFIRGRFAEQIRQDVIDAILPGHFRSAITEKNLHPVSQPQVTNLELEEGKDLRFKAAFEVIPDFSIEGYDQVKVEKPDATLTEAEFNEELERIRDSRSTMEAVSEERPLADGDFAEITFSGSVRPGAGAAEEVPEGEAQPIAGQDVLIEIGGKNTIESFSAALRGSRAGQELKFEASYPEDFGEQKLAGKTVAYDVEVKGLKKKVQPELNDEFAKELGNYEGFSDFSSKLREHLAHEKSRRLEAETRNRLLDALVSRYDFPVPESLVQQQIDTRLDRGLRALAAQGMRTEEMRKLDFDRLRAAQRDSATAEVKGSILLDRIADAEQVQVTEQEVSQELQSISIQTQETADALRKRLTENGSLARIREQLRREKVGSLLSERLPS